MEAKWFQRESDSTISKKFADKIADKPRIRVQLVLMVSVQWVVVEPWHDCSADHLYGWLPLPSSQ